MSYPTAWLLHQQISLAMAEQKQDGTHRRLWGVVQLDDPYLGSEYFGGKAGCGPEKEVRFVAAVCERPVVPS
ncbi:MAG: hypothetical protein IPJ08_20800 [Burkholderiales bacterium]|nr:hypothetical protein [Burkholderiales bacterium]